MKRPIALGLITLFVLTACGSGSAEANEPLVVYSGRGEELVAPLLESFTEETGIELEVRYGGSSELAATLIAEGDETEADVFFAQDPASLGAVAPMMTVLSDDTLNRVPPQFRDRDDHWIGTSGRARVVIYNTDADIALPQDIDDLTDPAWADHLGIAPTNASFLAFVAAMILERGEGGTRQWLEALAANNPIDFESNAPIVEATDNGELDGGLVNHYYLLRLRAEGLGEHAENYFIPAGDVGSLIMPAGVGIMSETARPEAAQRFVDYLLSGGAQSFFATDTLEYPLIEDVDPPAGVPHLSEINSPEIDLSDLSTVLDLATRLVAEAGLV
ncbi:MAG TPA: extracellular solute-binding protein [Acidimicrobiia bacterium]|nr:extracellular solute-binding protein [Acidimicrobiia bacterium]